MIFGGLPSGAQLLGVLLVLAAGVLFLAGLPLLVVGLVRWPTGGARGFVIAGGTALGLAATSIGWAYVLWT